MLMNMKEILTVAKKNGFAIPAFNISDYAMFLGIMEVCEETNSPVILEIHPDELKFIGNEMVLAIREKAIHSKVPVCIHLDHCSDFSVIVRAICAGFTSVMFDGAELPFEENISGTKKVIEIAHAAGAGDASAAEGNGQIIPWCGMAEKLGTPCGLRTDPGADFEGGGTAPDPVWSTLHGYPHKCFRHLSDPCK
ncbi:hypothetical protein FYJ34_11790 [Clostridiaceae bacterium 68-1-5]|uniref:Ketose-bisphosphate aldolase n=1 Tax=Suipraeoptans intestinalis TaxID=2606628 RepID=A0A6N7UTU4_9FIRM|nr:class II fructose-bisphosphate aldolase [Suipraeoptans intestinalis]MSR94878.1 hypothetical protein [Suipraeoptans intestinalis]